MFGTLNYSVRCWFIQGACLVYFNCPNAAKFMDFDFIQSFGSYSLMK